ncbi:hypothetical protein [Comamonas sp. B-9]|uniref:hypothetical protein n=1 Tax=Comamonas sp. B-9 TaxID=1055192 RepID=UPI0019552927|nr:hypothetical protein [Comamonas sp. B-9]
MQATSSSWGFRLAVEQQMSPSIAMFLLRCSKIMCATIFFANAVDRQQQIAGVRAYLPHCGV